MSVRLAVLFSMLYFDPLSRWSLWHVGWCLGDLGFPYFGANSGRWWRHTVKSSTVILYTSLFFFASVNVFHQYRKKESVAARGGVRWQWVYKRLLQFLRLRGLFWNVVGYAVTPRLCLGAIIFRSSKIIFSDTGSQLAVLTLLNFFLLSSDYWKYFTGQFACQCWCSYLACDYNHPVPWCMLISRLKSWSTRVSS
jgi:hypothetical protein